MTATCCSQVVFFHETLRSGLKQLEVRRVSVQGSTALRIRSAGQYTDRRAPNSGDPRRPELKSSGRVRDLKEYASC